MITSKQQKNNIINTFNNNLTKQIDHKSSNIKVYVRVRPLLPSQLNQPQCVTVIQNEQIIQIKQLPLITRQKVDKAFDTKCTQKQLYDYLTPTIQKILDGYNVTIMSYGQTNSGKTYTMFGSDWENIINHNQQKSSKKKQQTYYSHIESDNNYVGIIPRCIYHLIQKMYFKKKNVQIYCSFLQLYNQKLIDLLDNQSNSQKQLIIHQNKTDGIYVQGLTQIKVNNFQQCIEIMKSGQKNRIVRQTHMNIKSSRSHTLFQFLIQQVFPEKQSFRRTKLNLCDLAGSQKINKSQQMQIQHFKQLKNINLSLTTLGKVIWSLSSKDFTIPVYRQSKLTRLLQDSLGGNTYTNIIANITTKKSNLQESFNTLKFAQRAKQVKVEVFVKTYKDQPQLQQMQKQVIYLKGLLKGKKNDIESIKLSERIKQLQNENKQLKKIADKQLFRKLLDQNNKMKRQLQNIGNQSVLNKSYFNQNLKQFEMKSGLPKKSASLNGQRQKVQKTPDKKKIQSSQTLDRDSTSSQLPEIKIRTSNSKQSQVHMQNPIDINKNIIMRRLDMIERIKRENKQKLARQLMQIERLNSDFKITSDKKIIQNNRNFNSDFNNKK